MLLTEEELVLIKQGRHPEYFWYTKPMIWKNKVERKDICKRLEL